MAFRALPGFRDFYPEQMALRRHIEQAWHAAARGAGFQEIDGPPLELLDLFKAKSGEAIADELYAFVDKGGREVALRAELTPTLGRMAAERAASLPKPIKWYAVPQLFRYQRQQRGRLREHIQWNADILGAWGPAADAEVVAVAIDALQRLGLTEKEVCVRVSHRALVERRLRDLGCRDMEKALRLIDKGQLEAENAVGLLSEAAVRELHAWLDEPEEPGAELGEFLEACEDYGVAGFVEIDKHIVRGLAYYTGLVFEIFDRDRELRAIAGGGRYDGLVERLGGPAMPAQGFGMGDVVLGELLKQLGLVPAEPPRLDAFVVPIGEEMAGAARRVVRILRGLGRAAEAPFAPLKLRKAFKTAEAAGAKRIYLVGPDEWGNGEVKVKDLASGVERTVAFDRLDQE